MPSFLSVSLVGVYDIFRACSVQGGYYLDPTKTEAILVGPNLHIILTLRVLLV